MAEKTPIPDTVKLDAAEKVLALFGPVLDMVEGRQLFGTATHNVIQGVRAIVQEAEVVLTEAQKKASNGGQAG